MVEGFVEGVRGICNATVSEEFDYFRNLSDDTILSILSFLPIKDAVRTGTLSTRWKHMWKILPIINISFADISRRASSDRFDLEYDLFLIILHILEQRCDEVKTFAHLVHGCHPWQQSDCVSHTISLHSEGDGILLLIGLSTDEYLTTWYGMWKRLIRAMVQCGEVLVMKYTLFTCSSTLEHVGFFHHVSLENVELTNLNLDTLLGRCLTLKSLKISECKGVVEIRICHSCLKLLSIENCASFKAVEIFCSNLRTFKYMGEAIVIHFADVLRLERITYSLHGESVPVHSVFNSLFQTFDKLPAQVSCLAVKFTGGIERNLLRPLSGYIDSLRKLVICLPETHNDLLWLVYLLEAAPYLEDLIVIQFDPFSKNIASEESPKTISKPSVTMRSHSNLGSLEINGFSGHTTEIELILCILKCATSLYSIHVQSGQGLVTGDVNLFMDSNEDGTCTDETEKANASLLKAERARERAHRYLQQEIPPKISFTIA